MNSRIAAWLLAISLCLCLGLVLAVPIPPLLDYPNHLARLHILVDAILYGRENAFVAVDWSQAWLNTAMDAAGIALGALVGAGGAGTALICLAVVLPPLGAAVLNRTLFGGWNWWQVAFPIFAWNGSLVFGLVNFQIGFGLAFLLASLDHARRHRLRPIARFSTRAVASAALLLVHPFAAAFFAALLAGLALGRQVPWRGSMALMARRGVASALAVLACALPVLLYLIITPTPPGSSLPPGAEPLLQIDTTIAQRAFNALAPLAASVWTYDLKVDVLFLLPLWIAAYVVVSRGNGFRAHAGVLTIAATLAMTAVVLPPYVLGNGATNWRVGAMVGLTLVAGCRPASGARRGVLGAAAAAMFLLCCARTGWIAAIWLPSQADVASVRRALDHAAPGSLILPAEHVADRLAPIGLPWHRVSSGGQELFWHLPVLAVPWASAFVPTLFAAAGKQPLRVRPPWDALAVQEGRPTPMRNLAVLPEVLAPMMDAHPSLYFVRFLRDWRAQFDYVLVINADRPDRFGPIPDIPALELVADEGFAQLWRVIRPPRRGE